MTLAITVNNADYSANAIGWEAPTAAQPLLALIPQSATLKNLASGGVTPVSNGNAPTFTTGVQGQSLPRLTIPAGGGISTGIVIPQKMTCIIFGSTANNNTNYLSTPSNPTLIFGQRTTTVNNFLLGSGSDQLTVNASESVFGNAQIRMLTADFSSTSVTMAYQNMTTGVSNSGAATFSTVYTPSGTMLIGDGVGSVLTGTFDLSAMFIWDSILSSADAAAVVAWLRQYASSYGVTEG